MIHNDLAGTPPPGMRGQPFTLEQYAALDRLLGELCATYHVAPYRIVGHHQVLLMKLSPTGEALHTDRREVAKILLFDLGYWVSPAGVSREQLNDQFDPAMAHAVRAFQSRRFAGRSRFYRISPNVGIDPDAYGRLDGETLRLLLSARFS